MHTEFKWGKNYNIVCSYCEKTLVDLKEHWSFSLFNHQKIQEMIKKHLLVCDCDSANKDKELRLKMIEYRIKIRDLKKELSDLNKEEVPF